MVDRTPQRKRPEKPGWLDRPENLRRLLHIFYGCLAVLVVLDFFTAKHPYFFWQKAPGFMAVYGFMSCAALVTAARVLGRVLGSNGGGHDH